MKKFIALLLVLVMVLAMTACSAKSENTKITVAIYPVGNWGNQETVEALMAKFQEANPTIEVEVQYLTYADGDSTINGAIEAGSAPDIVMEGPERLVSNWGAKGLMVDLSDMVDDTDKAEINPAALTPCYSPEGKLYEYPVVMTAHCMAINKTVFEAAGAMEHINVETRTWKSTADYKAAVEKVYAHTNSTVGIVFCKDQGGDQGTRALINNMYGGAYTDAAHTEYTWNNEGNVKALTDLVAMQEAGMIKFDASSAGGDEIALFYNGTINMANCWNIAQQLNPNSANTGEAKTLNGDDIMFLAFPSDNTPALCGGIWGFGIFDNKDEARIEASKTFIKYFCDSAATVDAVKAANFFAVRDTAEGTDLTGIWADNEIMNQYNVLMPMLGDYYNVTPRWTEARASWWNMLQKVGQGEDIVTMLEQYSAEATGK